MCSVVDRNRHRLIRFDADPNPNFHFGADPDPDPDWHQNDADPHADPTASLPPWKIGNFLRLSKAMPVYNVIFSLVA
jgi:hypothetical protein